MAPSTFMFNKLMTSNVLNLKIINKHLCYLLFPYSSLVYVEQNGETKHCLLFLERVLRIVYVNRKNDHTVSF